MTLNLKHYAILTNSLFRVKCVPVLYLPIFYYPINKEDRATGFLMPLYGTSTIKGHTLSNAFFWAINRSQDATFLYDWFSKTGQGLGGEYRYVAAPGSDGQIRFYNLNEHEAEYDNGAGGAHDHAGARELPGQRRACRRGSARRSARAAAWTTSPTSASSRPTARTSSSPPIASA